MLNYNGKGKNVTKELIWSQIKTSHVTVICKLVSFDLLLSIAKCKYQNTKSLIAQGVLS